MGRAKEKVSLFQRSNFANWRDSEVVIMLRPSAAEAETLCGPNGMAEEVAEKVSALEAVKVHGLAVPEVLENDVRRG